MRHYRTIMAMTAVLLSFLVASIRRVTEVEARAAAERGHRRFDRIFTAQHQVLRVDCGAPGQCMASDMAARSTSTWDGFASRARASLPSRRLGGHLERVDISRRIRFASHRTLNG